MGRILADNPTPVQVQAATDVYYHGFDVTCLTGAGAMVKSKESDLKIRPLGDRLLVRRDEAEKMSKGGIALPDTAQAQTKVRKGTVLAVGPGKKLDKTKLGLSHREDDRVAERVPMDVSIGDRVYFQQWAGSEMDDDDKLLLMLREDEVLGVIEGE